MNSESKIEYLNILEKVSGTSICKIKEKQAVLILFSEAMDAWHCVVRNIDIYIIIQTIFLLLQSCESENAPCDVFKLIFSNNLSIFKFFFVSMIY